MKKIYIHEKCFHGQLHYCQMEKDEEKMKEDNEELMFFICTNKQHAFHGSLTYIKRNKIQVYKCFHSMTHAMMFPQNMTHAMTHTDAHKMAVLDHKHR